MKPLTPQQKKFGLIVIGVLLAGHFVLPAFTSLRRPSTNIKPPIRPASVDTPAPKSGADLNASAAPFYGIWTGQMVMTNMDICHVQLELRPTPSSPGVVSGYETRTCMPPNAYKGMPGVNVVAVVQGTTPVATKLTGSVSDGALPFRVDETVGAQPGHCEDFSSYSVTPFGQGRLVAQWETASCQSAHMLLTKTKG